MQIDPKKLEYSRQRMHRGLKFLLDYFWHYFSKENLLCSIVKPQIEHNKMGHLLVSIIKTPNNEVKEICMYVAQKGLHCACLCEINAVLTFLTYGVLQKPPSILATIHLDVCSFESGDFGLFSS